MKIQINLIIAILAFIGMAFLVVKHFTTPKKQVYIDTNILLSKYQGMIAAKAEFESKAKVWDANVDSVFSGFEQEIKAYEKERTQMSKKEKELKEELLRNKQLQIGRYQEAVLKKKKEEEQLLNQTAINTVNEFIKEYGKKHNYTFIFGASGMGNLLYAEKGLDITEEVLEGLNREYKK